MSRMAVRVFAVSLILIAIPFTVAWFFDSFSFRYLYAVPALLAVYVACELLNAVSKRRRANDHSS